MHLVDRLKDKEEDALTEIMKQYGDYLLRTAFLLVKDKQTAEEVVQDTFIKAFEKIEQLDDPNKLKSWLTTIAINRCRSQMRKWSWKNIFLNFETVGKVREDEAVLSPEEIVLDIARNESFSKAIQQLNYKYREVITLFYFNEMKITEIVNETNTNESTIKSRLKRGRLLLKEILMKGEEFGEGKESIEKTAR